MHGSEEGGIFDKLGKTFELWMAGIVGIGFQCKKMKESWWLTISECSVVDQSSLSIIRNFLFNLNSILIRNIILLQPSARHFCWPKIGSHVNSWPGLQIFTLMQTVYSPTSTWLSSKQFTLMQTAHAGGNSWLGSQTFPLIQKFVSNALSLSRFKSGKVSFTIQEACTATVKVRQSDPELNDKPFQQRNGVILKPNPFGWIRVKLDLFHSFSLKSNPFHCIVLTR